MSDIVVDKVGKYAYTIGSPHDTTVTPVVMDVTLDIRTKVRIAILSICYIDLQCNSWLCGGGISLQNVE